MADSKIDFSFENLHFSCEGDNLWVERQLNNVLSRIPALLAVHKKGEGIVEEVIEIEEEDLKEVPGNSRNTGGSRDAKRSKKTSRAKKVKGHKAGKKLRSDKGRVVQDDKIAEQEILTGESTEPTSEKVNESKIAKSGTAIKLNRGRKPVAKKLSVRSRETKKSAGKGKSLAEPIDSPLARFLTEKKADKNQVRKFLATAVFLSRSNDITLLSTPMISKALKSYGIAKLQNASDCLNKNEKKGNCIKTGKEFSITDAGFQTF